MSRKYNMEVLKKPPCEPLVGVYLEGVLGVGLYEVNVVGLGGKVPCARFVIARNDVSKRGEVVRVVSSVGDKGDQIEMEWLPNENPRIIYRSNRGIEGMESVCNVE